MGFDVLDFPRLVWIYTRWLNAGEPMSVETRIADLDLGVDALAVDMARMGGQLDLSLQWAFSNPRGLAAAVRVQLDLGFTHK